jgi:hypothetical protein
MRVLFFLSLFAFVASCSKSESNCFGFTEKDVTFAQELTRGVWINSDTIGVEPDFSGSRFVKFVCTLDSTKYQSITWLLEGRVYSNAWSFVKIAAIEDVFEVVVKGDCNGKTEEAKISFKPIFMIGKKNKDPNAPTYINPRAPEKTEYFPIWGTYNGFEAANPNQKFNITLFDTVCTPRYFPMLTRGLSNLGNFSISGRLYSLPTAAYVQSSLWGSDGSAELMARLYKKDSILVDVSFFEGGSLKYKRFRGKRQ